MIGVKVTCMQYVKVLFSLSLQRSVQVLFMLHVNRNHME